MYDFAVHSTNHNDMIVDYIKADSKRKALNLARKMYGQAVTVSEA